jgi:hypothetical protein
MPGLLGKLLSDDAGVGLLAGLQLGRSEFISY